MSITSRPVSRRLLLQGLAGAGLAGTLFGAAGCTSAVQEARSQQAVQTGGPLRGGTINAGISEDLIPGNFFTNSTAGITTVVGLAFESLIRYPDDSVKPTPRLATQWQLSKDGKSLELQLRDDVSFHSGRPFTSADAAFSIKTYGDPSWTAQLKSTASAITSFDTSDPHRLVLKFAHPLGNIFDLLDTVPIVDSQTIDQLRTGEKLIGTGPFKVASWTPNTKISFERNESYWIPDRPYADAVETKIITDAKALLAALKSGQVDFADGLSYLDTENLVKTGGFSDIRLTGAETQLYVGANVTAKPLDDVRVRQAIAYALDRDRVVTEVLRGVGYSVNLPWPKYSPAYDESRNSRYSRNLSKAKALVAEVGAIPTIPYTYATPNPSGRGNRRDRPGQSGRGGHPGPAGPGGWRPVRQAADRGQVPRAVDDVPLLGAVHPVDTDGQRLPVQCPPQRLAVRLRRLHRARRRRLADRGRHLAGGRRRVWKALRRLAGQRVPGRDRRRAAAMGPVEQAARRGLHQAVRAAADRRLGGPGLNPIMIRYLLRRLPSAMAVLFLASVVIFGILRLVPGDPATTLGRAGRLSADHRSDPACARSRSTDHRDSVSSAGSGT